MDKKGQGISINTIIIAAIALIVLVVLIAIFTGRIGSFGQGVDEATKKIACPGSVVNANQACPAQTSQLVGNYDIQLGQKCCGSTGQ